MSRPTGWVAVTVALAALVLAVAPFGRASASSGRVATRSRHAVPLTPVTALSPLTLGFSGGADVALASDNPAIQAEWVPKAHADGAQMVRIDVSWSSVAPAVPAGNFNASNPADPEYNWTKVDEQVREVVEGGFTPMINVSGAPKWAEGPGAPRGTTPGTWEPNAQDLGEFSTAIATRYDGSFPDPLSPGKSLPKVSTWQVWDEPNLPDHLSPEWVQTANGLQAVSPTIYRNMENAFYTAVKAVSPSNYVVLAGLAPYGDSPSASPSERMRPVLFLRSLLCVTDTVTALDPNCPGPTYFDAIDSHPYGIYGPTWHAYWADDVSVPDVHKLVTVLDAAQRFGTALPAGPKGNWVTETSWDTDPPDPGGVPIAEQALWQEQAFYILWKQGVSTILWWQIQDSPPIPSYAATYQAGTYYINGTPKPSSTSYRFPFITYRKNYATVMAWARAPATGIVSVQEQTATGWHTVARARVKNDEVFELPVHLIFRQTLRAQLGHYASLPWEQAG